MKSLTAVFSLWSMTSTISAAPAPVPLPIPAPLPMPDPGAVDINCFYHEDYNITSQEKYVAAPRLVTGVTVVGCDGCSISQTSTYSVTVTISVGGGLDIGKIVGLGVNAAVSIGTTTGESIGASLGCPSGAKCGLSAKPTLYRIKGFQQLRDAKCHRHRDNLYDISLPVLVSGASAAAQAEVEYSACYTPDGKPPQPIPGFNYPDCPPADETHT